MLSRTISSSGAGAVRSALGCRPRPATAWINAATNAATRCQTCAAPRRSVSSTATAPPRRPSRFTPQPPRAPNHTFTPPAQLSLDRTCSRLLRALKQLTTDTHAHLGDRLIAFGVRGDAVRWIWAQVQRRRNWKHHRTMGVKALQAEDKARAEVPSHEVAARLFREWAEAARVDIVRHRKRLEAGEKVDDDDAKRTLHAEAARVDIVRHRKRLEAGEKVDDDDAAKRTLHGLSGEWELQAAGEALRFGGDDALPRICMTVFLDWLQGELAALRDGKRSGALVDAPITKLAERVAHDERPLVESAGASLATLALVRDATDLRDPALAYPLARTITRHVHLHVGPTNSGKTHSALMALGRARTGVYAGPLRLLAHEVWDRLNAGTIAPQQLPPRACNLMTGEEQRVVDPLAGLVSCTVEMAPIGAGCDVAVIDEIQMLSDPARGFAWTKAVLGMPAKELHLCGEASAVPLVRKMVEACGDVLHVHDYERLTPLRVAEHSLDGKLSRVQKGDCVVTFSRSGIFAVKAQIEDVTGLKCAVAYGALPPETKSEQARLFNDPDSGFDVMVASDAIGMGLNLKINRVVFETLSKWNGQEQVTMSASQIKQIAGRAGRFGTQQQQQQQQDGDGEAAPAPAPGGIVTTLLPADLPTLRAALATPIIPLPRAAIQPNEDTLAQMSLLLPPTPRTARAAVLADEQAQRKAETKDRWRRPQGGGQRDATPPAHAQPPSGSLSSLYADVGLLARLDSSTYFLSEFKQQHQVSPLIERATRAGPTGTASRLTVAEREAIANAPANLRDERVAAILSVATARLAQGELVRFPEIEAGLGMLDRLAAVEAAQRARGPPDTPHDALDANTLAILESLHRSLTLYLWLSYRFPLAFCFRRQVTSTKLRTEAAIEFCLHALREGQQRRLRRLDAPDARGGARGREKDAQRWGASERAMGLGSAVARGQRSFV